MNPEAHAELDRILALSPAELTESEQAFLRARRSYLTEEQKAVHADALAQVASDEAPAVSDEEEPRARKGRKAAEQPEA